jgi:hypothetical protein
LKLVDSYFILVIGSKEPYTVIARPLYGSAQI